MIPRKEAWLVFVWGLGNLKSEVFSQEREQEERAYKLYSIEINTILPAFQYTYYKK